MITSKETLQSLSLLPQEEMLEVQHKQSKLVIGIPKETSYQEHRVALVPDAVAVLVNNGHEIIVERGAGKDSHFQDTEYSEAGASIANGAEEVFQADLILKVAPPSLKEIQLMKQKQTLISALQLTVQPKDFLRELMNRRVTAVAWDYIRDEDGMLPIVRAMGEIAGTTSILIAGENLSNVNQGAGLMLGGISGVVPTEVVIIGAGTVGEYATRAALGLGASVKVFDNSIYKLRRLEATIGKRLYTSTIQPTLLAKALSEADVAIGAIRASHGRTPCVVTEEMAAGMKEGSVVVDISIDQGGCFETSKVTSHEKPTYQLDGVTYYCVPNIASRVSKTASHAISNIFAPILLNMGEFGGITNVIRRNVGIRHGVYMYNGTVTNEYLAESYSLPYKNLDLLMAAM